MADLILTLNAGSSSIKFAVYAIDVPATPIARGQIDGLGTHQPRFVVKVDDRKTEEALEAGASHAAGLARVVRFLDAEAEDDRVVAIGHRIVHGGEHFRAPVVLDAAIEAELATLNPLAPLHQPHNLAGVAAARAAFPETPQVACFDTGFHRTQPFLADVFALPRAFYAEGVRRYGFHGLSYEYVAREHARLSPVVAAGRVIIAHLGNGASMCAVKDGRSVACTMGFSPLDGIPMGTRTGQIDPGVLLYLIDEKKLSGREISDLLYRKSGLLGLSGISQDMRELEASDAPEAREAIDYFTYRIRREVGSLAAALGGLDGLVFCGGIGENAKAVRAAVCEGLGFLGLVFDPVANAAGAGVISAPESGIEVRVIRTDEEAQIVRHALAVLGLYAREAAQ